MKNIIKKSKNKPTKIHPVRKSEFAETLNEQTTYVRNFVNSSKSKGEPGDVFPIRNPDGAVEEIIFVTEDKLNIWSFAGLPRSLPPGDYELDGELNKQEATNALVGWQLGCYKFNRYHPEKSKEESFPRLVAPKNADYDEAAIIVEGVTLARDLINTPAADMGPKELAQIATNIARDNKADQNIFVGEELLAEGYESIFTVGKGSPRHPRLIDLRWGDENDPKVTLVGKGVCFDTGGLNLKSEGGMLTMKKDMGGAAITLALAQMIIKSKLNVNLRLLLPIVENSVSGDSMRPSDIINTRAGISVEVTNTDAEGRLILCEPLAEADSENPELLIDIATLTGAARVAVGLEISAFFTQDDKLAEEIETAAKETADPVWRLPLWEGYRNLIKGKITDIINSPETGNGGSITAALFLKEFVKNTKSWVHLDLAAWNAKDSPGKPTGGEAMALRALFALLKKRYS